MVGHLANQEHRYWVQLAQGQPLSANLNDLVGYGKPASTPPLAEMWAIWEAATQAADIYLETLTPAMLETHLERDGRPISESVGTLLQRTLYHYWYHLGSEAVRQCWATPIGPSCGGAGRKAPYRRDVRGIIN
jgi:hypothetical protein